MTVLLPRPRKSKKNDEKSTNRICKRYKYTNTYKNRAKIAKMVKSDGLNEVGDKNLIIQNDRLATATQKIKKKCRKIHKSYL